MTNHRHVYHGYPRDTHCERPERPPAPPQPDDGRDQKDALLQRDRWKGSTPLNRGQAAWGISRSQLGGRPRRLTTGKGTGKVSSSCIVQR